MSQLSTSQNKKRIDHTHQHVHNEGDGEMAFLLSCMIILLLLEKFISTVNYNLHFSYAVEPDMRYEKH